MLPTMAGTASQRVLRAMAMGLAIIGAAGSAHAQGPQGRGRMMNDPGHVQDMQVMHELLDNGAKVTRTVTLRPDGVETLTESNDPALADLIKTHVGSMSARITEGRPIHMRDPLFRAIFENASRITLKHELTAHGVKVIETSTDPYVVKLVQAHAEVLNQFIKNGRREAMANHDVPAR